jgi:hypothetical protein
MRCKNNESVSVYRLIGTKLQPLQRGRLNLESKFFVVGISNFLTQTNNSLFEMSIFKLKLLK